MDTTRHRIHIRVSNSSVYGNVGTEYNRSSRNEPTLILPPGYWEERDRKAESERVARENNIKNLRFLTMEDVD